MPPFSDTIAAIATPLGQGGIAIIRVSGAEARQVVAMHLKGHADPRQWTPNHIWLDFFQESHEEPLDQVLVCYFQAPKSYTGEDVVEISCHGGRYLAGLILESILGSQVRVAEPGEFTKRAFVNGRLDLTQAEAVADLIHAKTRESIRYAMRQLRGGLSNRIMACREQMIALLGSLELELDFSEEDIVLVPKTHLLTQIEKLQQEIVGLAHSYQRGRFIHDGIKITMAGKSNVGKSTLFNALVGHEKAIVDDSPGTTRDALEAQLDINGTLFRLIDTAGFRKAAQRVEKKGILVTEKHLEETDIILFLLDFERGYTEEDAIVQNRITALLRAKTESPPEVLVLWNKSDLPGSGRHEGPTNGWKTMNISAVTGMGFEHLHQFLASFLHGCSNHGEGGEDAIITNLRHQKALIEANKSMENARSGIESGLSNEFVAVDMREALNQLGQIVGKTTTDDVLDYVFANYCIGK